MDITIGEYDATKRTVSVTFDHEGVIHTRDVNAVLNESGEYDASATSDRVDEVARGVIRKISLGVINNDPTPEPAPVEPDA